MRYDAEYFLPFDSSKNPVRISQGRNGPWSHFIHRREISSHPGVFVETDLLNAVDFALPLDTPILAAREGKVKDFWLRSAWCYEDVDSNIGNNPPPLSTNFMVIEHDDGTKAWYSHLSQDRLVSIGQVVRRGHVIATTGKSGWIAKIPHLHFQVIEERFLSTLPIAFQDYEGSLDHKTLLRQGLIYSGLDATQGVMSRLGII